MLKRMFVILMYMMSLVAIPLVVANPIGAPTDIAVKTANDIRVQAKGTAVCSDEDDCYESGACVEGEDCSCYSGRCYPGVEDNRNHKVESRSKIKARDGEVELRTREKIRTENAEIEVRMKSRTKMSNDILRIEHRELARERVRDAQEGIVEARQRYKQAANEYESKKREFIQVRKRVQECKSDNNCSVEDANREALLKAKEYLLEALERMKLKIEETKARIEASESLTEERANAAIDRLDAILLRMDNLATVIEDATTKREIQQASRTLRTAWNTFEKDIKRLTYMNAGKKVGLVVRQAELMEHKLACAADSLDANASSEIKDLLDSFDSEVAAARAEFEIARAIWEDEDSTNVEDARAAIRRGHDHLKRAHEILKDAVRKIREEGGSFAGCGAPQSESGDSEEGSGNLNETDDMDDESSTNESDINQTQ